MLSESITSDAPSRTSYASPSVADSTASMPTADGATPQTGGATPTNGSEARLPINSPLPLVVNTQVQFNHIIDVVFEQGEDGPICLAFKQNSVTMIHWISSLSDKDINNLTYIPTGSTLFNGLDIGHRNRIKLFCDYVKHHSRLNDIIIYTSLTSDEVMSFVNSEYYPYDPHNYLNSQNQTTTTTAASIDTHHQTNVSFPSAYHQPTLKDLFLKQVKHDVTQFPSLKSEEHWDNWNFALCAVARTQGVAEVLD